MCYGRPRASTKRRGSRKHFSDHVDEGGGRGRWLKHEEIYNIFDTDSLLRRPLGVNVTDKAGAAGVAFWVNSRLGLRGDQRLDKRHPGIAAMTEWAREQYAHGRSTSLSEDEMLGAARRNLPELFE